MIEDLHLPQVAVFMPTRQEMYPGTISMDVNEQRGAFVEVLGLSAQVFTLCDCLTNSSSSKAFRDRTFLEE